MEFVKSIYENLVKFSKNQIEELKANNWVWGVKGLADWVAPVNSENEEVDPNTSEGAEICGTGFVYKMLESMLYISDVLGIKENIEEFKNAGIGGIYILPLPENFRPSTMKNLSQ